MAAPQYGSPEWWRNTLHTAIGKRQVEVKKFEDYYNGTEPLPIGAASTKYRIEFNAMINTIRDNWMALVVDAVEERLYVEGFRFGEDPKSDKDAWTMWQANNLDSDSELGHSTALTTGEAFAMVWIDECTDQPSITIEHPAEVYVANVSGSRRCRAAAIKEWKDEWTAGVFANVYLPDRIVKWVDAKGNGRWEFLEELANPLGCVPIVPLVNRPRLSDPCGRSEINEVLSTQDQINKLVCDMIVASEFSAFKQRWATGIEIAKDPDTGLDLETFTAAVDRLWHVGDPDAKFGEFTASDLSNYTEALTNRIQSLASRTRTPPHYLLGGMGTWPSGESLRSAETGLIAKVRKKQRHFGEAWEEVIRLGFAVINDPRKDAMASETIWRDPESRTESEHIDSLVKKITLKVPFQQLWEDAGYTPQQIARFRVMLVEQALDAALQTPLPPSSGDYTNPNQPAGSDAMPMDQPMPTSGGAPAGQFDQVPPTVMFP